MAPDATREVLQRWQRALRLAMARGWEVVNLARIAPSARGGPIALVTEMLGLLGYAGRYQPYSLPRSHGTAAPEGFVIVPGEGALHFLPTQRENALDGALLYADPEQVALLRDHAEVLRSQATPILKLYRGDDPSPNTGRPRPDPLRYDFARTQAALRPGERLLVKDGLSVLRIPNTIYTESVRRLGATGEASWSAWIPTLVENRLQRIAAFNEQVRRWRFIDLCSRPAVERMVRTGSYTDDTAGADLAIQRRGLFREIDAGAVPATPDERRALLRSVLDLLLAHPNYELGLLDDARAREAAETYWEVKGLEGDAVLLLDTWCLSGDRAVETNLEIGEPGVVEAFRGYFLSVWETLPPEQRDKGKVIAWLEGQIATIPAGR